ncbi:G-type lectin S-receptor-like serine/threonine-protein kinase SD1-1 isoform X2 [Cajanus cajan]|nr:G-type lectin S-receptor-like serine/threonine-protein kinase SD1-1 isoform X2 [Cajanus cajan]
MKAVAIIIIVASVLTIILALYVVGKRIKKLRAYETENKLTVERNEEDKKEDLELPFFHRDEIIKATDGFSINNKLGEGGFGAVYMGTLADGQEIAVKRLSQSSGQGFNEFKNEVILIAKLQHRNLVKLVGCCIEGEEKMLIYEYMPNKSLDSIIFDHAKGKILDWSKRFNIIGGIARGLLYLHQDSRLRIIHRDLKASNVLLDHEFNPKISDFGMAKTFGGDEIEGNTRRVVGTYGYMAPEYAIYGLFSVKSDVFSFGVLMLEIISGKKNRGFSHSNNSINLIDHAWRFWKENRPLDLIDSCMENSSVLSEALRCIHIGLLCVQQHPEDRPSMSTVVVMLSSESALPQPKEPAFLMEKGKFFLEADSSTKHQFSSTNDISVTLLEPR